MSQIFNPAHPDTSQIVERWRTDKITFCMDSVAMYSLKLKTTFPNTTKRWLTIRLIWKGALLETRLTGHARVRKERDTEDGGIGFVRR